MGTAQSTRSRTRTQSPRGRPPHSARACLEGILFVLVTGCQWENYQSASRRPAPAGGGSTNRAIAAKMFRAAPTTFGRLQRHNFVALVGRDQRPLVPGMSRLPARLFLRFRLRFHRFGIRMLRAWRQRRILRRLPQALEFRFQPGNPLLIVTNDGLDHRALRVAKQPVAQD